MEPVRLVLAEKSLPLQRVLQAGLERHDFQVMPVRTLAAAAAACIEGSVRVVLLDEGLTTGGCPEWSPRVTVVMMADAAPLQTPCLWIRKPFDPELLAAFLMRRCRRTRSTVNRRRHYREQVFGTALVVAERTGLGCFTDLLDVSPEGCSVYASLGIFEGEHVQVLLRPGRAERALRGIVRNVRLTIAEDGELRRALGVEFVD